MKNNNLQKIYHELEKSGTIKKFRKAWRMPVSGFKNDSQFQKWHSEEKIGSILNLSKYKEHRTSAQEYYESTVEVKTLAMADEVNQIITENRIPEYLFEYVLSCLVLTKPPRNIKFKTPDPKVEIRENNSTQRKELWVRIYGYTSLKDLKSKKLWRNIKKLQPKLHDYKFSTKEIHINLYNNYHMQKWTLKHMIKMAKLHYGYEIKSTNDASKILQRIKEKLNSGQK